MSVGKDDALRIAKSDKPTNLYLISCSIFESDTPEESAQAFIDMADCDGNGEVDVSETELYT